MGPFLEALAARLGPEVAAMLERITAQGVKSFLAEQAPKIGKFAATQINKPIDLVETTAMKSAYYGYLKNKVTLDLLSRAETYGARQAITYEAGFPGLKARAIYNKIIEIGFANQSKAQAFTGGYVRGVVGETTANIVGNRVINFITGKVGQGVLKTPATRGFLRSIKALRGNTKLNSPTQLLNLIKHAYKDNANFISRHNKYVDPRVLGRMGLSAEHFGFAKGTGYVAGRLTAAAATQFVFVNEKTRKKNIAKFKRASKKFVKSPNKAIKQLHGTVVHVNAYRRGDGTYVRAYDRTT